MHRFEEETVVPALGAPPRAAGPEDLQHRRPILLCHPRQHGRLLPNRPAKCHRSTNVGIHSPHTQPNPSTRPSDPLSLSNLGATVPAELLIEHLNHIFLHRHAFLGYECLELVERLLVDPHGKVFAPDPITRDLWSFLFVWLSHDGWSRDRALNPLVFRD